jgi:hypothetical protein
MSTLAVRLSRPTTILASVAIGGATYASIRGVHADTAASARVFGRGPAFVSLPLESSEQVNHNTKLLRFKLPNEGDLSGLSWTCEYLPKSSHHSQTDSQQQQSSQRLGQKAAGHPLHGPTRQSPPYMSLESSSSSSSTIPAASKARTCTP